MSVALTQRRFQSLPPAEQNLSGSSAGMHTRSALRECSHTDLRQQISQEMREIVEVAAGSGVPGEYVKETLRRAHRNLGRPKFWRVQAAWKGEAGDWSGWAIEDFRERSNDLRTQREKRKYAQASAMGARLREMRDGLARTDPEFFGPQIDALEWALRGGSSADKPEG